LSCNALTDSLSGFLKLLLQAPNVEDSYPERPGEPDCPVSISHSSFRICLTDVGDILIALFLTLQYLLNNRCKFKSKCKFNHPKDMVNALGTGTNNEVS
jgi:hypothetical protein